MAASWKSTRIKKIREKRGGLFLLDLEKGYARMQVSIYVRVFKCEREKRKCTNAYKHALEVLA